MSFSFGFSGDDIEDDGQATEHEALTNKISECALSHPRESPQNTVEPKRHSLDELLASLPSQISYSTLRIPSSSEDGKLRDTNSNDHGAVTSVCRRSVFDIRAQLMAEANPSAEEEEEDTARTLLSGLESGDLSSGIYEGGFKTWECALDLASLVISETYLSGHGQGQEDGDDEGQEAWEVVELGAGSAVPTLALMQKFLDRRRKRPTTHGGSLKVTLCDYNADVLRLATAPNVLLNYLFASSGRVPHPLGDRWTQADGDLDLEELGGEALVSRAIQDMTANDISFEFISGGWGPAFLDLVYPPSPPSPQASLGETDHQHQHSPKPTNLLILASETVYSPSSIKAFTETVLGILASHYRRFRAAPVIGRPPPPPRAWVAAKRVYFGVGGGVDEFVREVDRLGGRSRVVVDVKDAGVGRVVLEVTLSPAFMDSAANT
ncbi:hypothetical protein Z517_02888 [Fonsecaea pedrosoi CBS 271.37]|uniref:protein-histidine N-methyltransferase n=1 Tax=Fonsecaea pedrosoi CBS 271.37 TaxID=1442368 RepID=A0A0D2FAG7_9EURO|nr:uncharacterized protein Z517_02888 [Fonsecaea pedrosoi CBS 271.37]KIW83642.1 hypothetical protein Z517_02888 [Fonsecaea pedrosoi CBS 271.37]